MLSQEVLEYMERSVLCWLATSSTDGQPNVSPKELFTPFKETAVLVANIASPKTLRNLKSNPKVCLSFVEVFDQKGYQLHGSARLIRNRSEREAGFKLLEAMAGPKFPIHSLLFIEVERITPILAPSYVMYPETTVKAMREAAMDSYGVRAKDH